MRRAEWRGSSFAKAAHQFGLKVPFLEGRHDRVVNQLCRWYQFMPYEVGEIFLLGGAARTEVEVVQFIQAYRSYRPKYAVLITPLGVDMSDG